MDGWSTGAGQELGGGWGELVLPRVLCARNNMNSWPGGRRRGGGWLNEKRQHVTRENKSHGWGAKDSDSEDVSCFTANNIKSDFKNRCGRILFTLVCALNARHHKISGPCGRVLHRPDEYHGRPIKYLIGCMRAGLRFRCRNTSGSTCSSHTVTISPVALWF